MSIFEEEKEPGQFNFINSRLRMNENYAENQNEYEKMSFMVKNLVECKINQVFKDIEHVNEDLKTQISYAINAYEEKIKENVNNPSLTTSSDNKSIQEAVNRLTEENKKLTEENAAKLSQEAANKKLTEENAAKLTEENKKLTEENKKLTEEKERLTEEKERLTEEKERLTEEADIKSVNDNPTNKSKNDIDAFYIATKKLKEV